MARRKVAFTLLAEAAVEEKPRNFKFDLNALADFEQEVGMGFGQLMQMKAVFAATRALLWAGLKQDDRTLTIQKMGQLMQAYVQAGGGLNELLGAAMKAAQEQGALGRAADDDDVEEGDGTKPADPPAAAAPTPGSTSSDS